MVYNYTSFAFGLADNKLRVPIVLVAGVGDNNLDLLKSSITILITQKCMVN